MRKLLNTLYVTTSDAYLSKDGLNVVVSVDKEERFRIPIVNIEGIVTFGYMGASPGLMKLCGDYGVSLSFMSPNGTYIGSFSGKTKGNVLLRKQQYRMSEDERFSLHISKSFVGGKILNSRNTLSRFVRDYGERETIAGAIQTLKRAKRESLEAEDIDSLRGIEGAAANSYFGVFRELILPSADPFQFEGRNKRPPHDEINAMLSFIYTLLANECAAALESVGLDPYVGFMHTIRPGRQSLALDLMEEFRSYIGDRLVLSLVNRRQVRLSDFVRQGNNSVQMTPECKKTIIKAWQSRKKEEIIHPFLEQKTPIGLLPYSQALLMARFLRGDIDDYPVFISA